MPPLLVSDFPTAISSLHYISSLTSPISRLIPSLSFASVYLPALPEPNGPFRSAQSLPALPFIVEVSVNSAHE